MDRLVFPHRSLILLAGPMGSGKTTLASRLFADLNVISAEMVRSVIADNPRDQSVNAAAWDMVRQLVRKRLSAGGRPTVVDATSLKSRDRAGFVAIAQELGVPAFLVVLDATGAECAAGLTARGQRVPGRALERQLAELADTKARLVDGGEGFARVLVLNRAQADAVQEVVFVTHEASQLDVIGDVHGCVSELRALLAELGYRADEQDTYRHPQGRLAVFCGDLIDHGPSALETLGLVDRMVAAGSGAMGALGNHDIKLFRALVEDRPVVVGPALQATLDEVARAEEVSSGARSRVIATLQRLFTDAPANSVLAGGELVVTHAAIEYGMQGKRTSPNRRDPISMTCMYGQTSDRTDESGKPELTYDWADTWPAQTTVVFGHDVFGATPTLLGEHRNVVSLDTGCAYGGYLTALRWPERECVGIGALRNYALEEHEPALAGVTAAPLEVVRRPLAQDASTPDLKLVESPAA